MGNCVRNQSPEENKAIELEIKQDRRELLRLHKILLLGCGDAGRFQHSQYVSYVAR
jgi:hypothetical protein